MSRRTRIARLVTAPILVLSVVWLSLAVAVQLPARETRSVSIEPPAHLLEPAQSPPLGEAGGSLLTSSPLSGTETLSPTIYLPLTTNRWPLVTVFGVEMSQLSDADGLPNIQQARTTWVRGPRVIWSAIEPDQGTRDWSKAAGLEQRLNNARQAGLTPIVVIYSTPEWAREVPDSACGPIRQDMLPAFGDFMYDVVQRYSGYPYNVKYWEIWNEPDVPVKPGESVYGCWGNEDESDPYYGGGDYAEMLKAVYPRIKQADPQAQVLVGGLLLNCDPRVQPDNCRSSKYLEGILLNGGGNYFDGVSFHAYDYYDGALGQYSNSNWQSSWNTTGPALNAKAGFIRSILAAYGVGDKYLMNTETALLCDACTDDSTFELTKAAYLVQAYAAAIAQDLKANIWFSVLGWRNSGLLNSDLTPRPAYTAFAFARGKLEDATLVRAISEYNDISGYEFNTNNRRIWLIWSLDELSSIITLPGTPLAIYDTLGQELTLSTQLEVGVMPLFVEW